MERTVPSKKIQLAGDVCLASRSWSDTDPITRSPPSISTPLPPATARLCVCLCERWLELCKVSYWSSTVASRPLKIITVAHLHLERRRGMRAPASVASSHILLNVFHFNHPRFFLFFFFLISPIPFSSQVHLAFIQKFNSALERLGLYLKPYR